MSDKKSPVDKLIDDINEEYECNLSINYEMSFPEIVIPIIEKNRDTLEPKPLRFRYKRTIHGVKSYELVDNFCNITSPILGYCQPKYYCENIAKRLGYPCVFEEE